MTEMTTSTLDVEPFRLVRRRLDELGSAGWVVDDAINDIRATRTTDGLSVALGELAPLLSAISTVEVEAIGVSAGFEMRLRRVGGAMEVVSLPAGDPRALFEGGVDLENALKAWDRDASAAQLLPLRWTVVVYLLLDGLVPPGADFDLRVAVNPSTIVNEFTAASLPALNRLVPSPGRRRVYLSLTGEAAPVHLGTISLATTGATSLVVLPRTAMPMPGEAAAAKEGSRLLSPHCLVPLSLASEQHAEWAPAIDRCVAAAATATWALLASNVEVAGDSIFLDFLGFKRIRLSLADPKRPEPSTENVFKLRAWALQDTSPDRLLAVRQVISLYENDAPFMHAEDVQASAEIIYIGLRSDAVAEVVKSSRDAQAQTNDTVRQSLKSSQDLVKAATERFLAGLISIGAVAIANASRSLSDEVSRNLMLLIASFFGVLALIATFVEGPLLSLQIKYLAADLRTGSSLLTEQQRQAIVNGASARATRLRIRIVRWVVPSLHLALALAILRWGYPARFR